MAELDKNKAGLQKQVSSVFKGVPLPQNKSAQKPSDTSEPGRTPGAFPKSKPADNSHVSKSSLISKLSQSGDWQDGAGKKQTANVFPKPASIKPTPQSPLISEQSRPRESPKPDTPAAQSDNGPFVETAGVGLLQQIKDKLFTPKPGVSPARQKAMIIMVPILAIIMIFAFRQVLSKAPRKTKGAGTDDAPVVANVDTGHEIDWKIPEPITIISRDPIKLPDESNTQVPEQGPLDETAGDVTTGTIMVRDIVYSDDKPSALVGSKIVYVGDVISGVTVVKIDRDSVEFEKDGERWEQKVREVKSIILETDRSEGRLEPIK